jgi:hypothetical protein
MFYKRELYDHNVCCRPRFSVTVPPHAFGVAEKGKVRSSTDQPPVNPLENERYLELAKRHTLQLQQCGHCCKAAGLIVIDSRNRYIDHNCLLPSRFGYSSTTRFGVAEKSG